MDGISLGGRRAACGVLALVACAGLVAGCGDGESSTAPTSSGPPATANAGAFPQTVDDCKELSFTYEHAPTRVVTMTVTVMEQLYWLGVGDRIVGTGEGPTQYASKTVLPSQFQERAAAVEVLAAPYVAGEEYLGMQLETLLSKSPDFVVSDFESPFGSFKQSDLTDRQIPSYLTFSTECANKSAQTSLDLVYRDIENLGNIFGAGAKADEVIEGMKAKVATVAERVERTQDRPRVLYLSGDELAAEHPSSVGNAQVVNAVIGLAGGKNVFDDIDSSYTDIGWEEMAARNPDAIVVSGAVYEKGDSYDAIIAKAKQVLATNPATRNMPAVSNGRIIDIDYWIIGAGGVRNADAVVDLARELHPDAFE